MLRSVQFYVRGLIDQLAMPAGVPGPLTAWVTPPVQEKLSTPKAYVWGGRVRGSRQASPRGPGLYKLPWTIDVYLAYMDAPDDALQNEPYPGVVDAVLTTFLTATMPTFIDSSGNPVGSNATGPGQSQIQAIGEGFSLDYPPERTVLSQRQIWYSSLISLDVLEVIQR